MRQLLPGFKAPAWRSASTREAGLDFNCSTRCKCQDKPSNKIVLQIAYVWRMFRFSKALSFKVLAVSSAPSSPQGNENLARVLMPDGLRTQCLHLRQGVPHRQRGSAAGKSRSIPMPRAPLPGPTPQMLQQAAYDVLQKCQDALPCNNLGLTATEFQVSFKY